MALIVSSQTSRGRLPWPAPTKVKEAYCTLQLHCQIVQIFTLLLHCQIVRIFTLLLHCQIVQIFTLQLHCQIVQIFTLQLHCQIVRISHVYFIDRIHFSFINLRYSTFKNKPIVLLKNNAAEVSASFSREHIGL